MQSKKTNRRFSPMPDAGRQLRCHCGRPAILRSAEGLSRAYRPGMMAYVCSNYPQCDSFVLAHPGTLRPMGSLADSKLRRLRYEAHQEFDQLYESGLMTKQEAYQWLSYMVQAPMEHAHIGHLGEYYCQIVIQESRKLLRQKRTERGKCKNRPGGEPYAAAY